MGAQSQPLQPPQTPISTSPQEAVEPTAQAIQRSTPDQAITPPTTQAAQRSPEGAAAETIGATAEAIQRFTENQASDASAAALDPNIQRPAEPTVAQLLAQNAVPQHPASLAPDITVTQPISAMGLVQPLVEPPGSAPDDIADKESSSFRAMSQSSVSRNQAWQNRQAQQQRDEQHKQQLDLQASHNLPLGVISGVHGPTLPGLTEDVKTRTMMQDALKTKVQIKEVVEAREGKPTRKISPSEMGELKSAFLPVADVQVQSKQEKQEDEKEVDGQAFELLAREVYHLLQQRLIVEKERYGGYYRDRSGL